MKEENRNTYRFAFSLLDYWISFIIQFFFLLSIPAIFLHFVVIFLYFIGGPVFFVLLLSLFIIFIGAFLFIMMGVIHFSELKDIKKAWKKSYIEISDNQLKFNYDPYKLFDFIVELDDIERIHKIESIKIPLILFFMSIPTKSYYSLCPNGAKASKTVVIELKKEISSPISVNGKKKKFKGIIFSIDNPEDLINRTKKKSNKL